MIHILVTNDDGIYAPGIKMLWQELSRIGKVAVVAPDSERSATSHAITVNHPIRVDEFCVAKDNICGWRISGTPSDCVKIAVEALLPEPPDVIVSGINQGPNLGTDVIYSGTVSAAIEGAMHGIPSLAISLDSWLPSTADDFRPAAVFAVRLVQLLQDHALPPNTLLNVNVPALPEDRIQGVAITKLGVIRYKNTFEKRQDPRGRIYYWMGGDVMDTANEPDSDVEAVKSGKISVTPIHFDLTNYAIINLLKGWDIK